ARTSAPPPAPTASASDQPSSAATGAPPPDPASVHANELGRVPVLMYHRIVEQSTGDYERSPARVVAGLTFSEKNGRGPITVAVHTVHHVLLSSKSDAVVQAEIADNLHMINTADPAQKVTTMALPFGGRPKVHELAQKGSSGGTSYDFAGVMAVGANPSHSPY